MLQSRPRIIDVERKPAKCPKCGGDVVDIIYGTGDMTEIEFMFAYRKQAIMGGDNIPRRPPIWACECGCKRFRKVNPDGTDAPVKPKLLKNVRKAPLARLSITTAEASQALDLPEIPCHHYKLTFLTNCGEQDTVRITATDEVEARMEVRDMLQYGKFGLKGKRVIEFIVTEEEE